MHVLRLFLCLFCIFYFASDQQVRADPSLSLQQTLHDKGFRMGDEVFIRIFKQERQLEIWMRSRKQGGPFDLLRVYPICAYSGTLGPKQKEGDRQAPEGFYTVTLSALNPHSRYHLSFNLGYPNQYDRAHGRTGSYLMVHGNCVSIGCYAMTDEGIEEIYKLVEASLNSGSKQVSIHIFPFHMTPENLNKHSTSVWLDFWQNLQEGYDWFDRNRYPPRIAVVQKRYHILNENSQP